MPIEIGAPSMETQSAFMAAAAALVLLVAVLRARRDPVALCFAALTGVFGLWAAARGAASLDWPQAPLVANLSLALLGSLAPATAAAFTGSAGWLGGLRVVLWLGPPALAGLLLGPAPTRPLAGLITTAWAIAGVGVASYLLARSTPDPRTAPSPDATRLRYLAVAHGIALFGATADLAAWQLGVARVGALLAPLLYLYAGYLHLARVRVADLRQLMGNAVSLTLLAGGLAGSFAALWLWVGPRLELFLFNAFVASFLLLLLLEPGRERIQRAMDRRFVAGRLELERLLEPLRERLPQIFTLDVLLSELLETLDRFERLRASAVFLRDDPQVGFQQVASFGQLPRRRVNLIRDPLWVEALEAGEPLLAEEIEKALPDLRKPEERTRGEATLRVMRQLDAQLVLPLAHDTKLLGFWTLSDERAFEPFSSSELEVLCAVADQISATIANSRTFERVRVRDRLASLGEMAAGLAHEIRNPLAAIRGALAVLEDPKDEQSREIHGVIVEEIARLDRVVGTFLDYARPAAPPAPILDLGQFVRRCAEDVARGYRDGEVALDFEIERGLAAPTANADQLERVIENLVRNAYQALDGKGALGISVRRAEGDEEIPDCVEIVVEDDGPGMDEPTLERALIPFFTTRDEGTGLGLALCDRLVRAQHGALRLRSRLDEGTAAVIRLPCPQEEPDA
jgi:signal transduction histidine kinase